MRKKFSEREIVDYINGEDIANVEALESNPYFMAAVIRKTGDYGIYEVYCSKKIKISPIIMKTMLEIFGNDYLDKDGDNFYKGLNILSRRSESIDNYYSNNFVVNTQFIEMLILLFKLDNSESDIAYDYFLKEIKSYTDEYGVIDKDYSGLFGRLCSKYNSDIVQEYFAMKLTDKILNDVFYDGIDILSYRGIENIVHSKISDKSLLDDEMVVCSIISCTAEVDTTLASYLSEHKELLEQYGKYAKSYYEHWDSYEADKMFNTVDSFVTVVENYIIDHQLDANSKEISKAIGKRYGIEDVFDDYYERIEEKLEDNDQYTDEEIDMDDDKRRELLLERCRNYRSFMRAEKMIDNDVFRPLLSLARRTFSIDSEESKKVLSLSSFVAKKVSIN